LEAQPVGPLPFFPAQQTSPAPSLFSPAVNAASFLGPAPRIRPATPLPSSPTDGLIQQRPSAPRSRPAQRPVPRAWATPTHRVPPARLPLSPLPQHRALVLSLPVRTHLSAPSATRASPDPPVPPTVSPPQSLPMLAHWSAPSSPPYPAVQQTPAANLAVTLARALHGTHAEILAPLPYLAPQPSLHPHLPISRPTTLTQPYRAPGVGAEDPRRRVPDAPPFPRHHQSPQKPCLGARKVCEPPVPISSPGVRRISPDPPRR